MFFYMYIKKEKKWIKEMEILKGCTVLTNKKEQENENRKKANKKEHGKINKRNFKKMKEF